MRRRAKILSIIAAATAVAGLGAGVILGRAPQATPEVAAPIAAEAAVHAAPGPHYSPFVVQMSHPELPFHQISFKDVGMSVAPKERAFMYETIAQSLAVALAEHPQQPMSSEVLFSSEAADPNSHLACGSAHIYVDLWQPSAERYGYSLWSGCGEDDQFRWQEVDGSVEPLAHDIAEALRRAVQSNCFTRHC